MKHEQKPNAFAVPVRVYYEDTDAGGVVYYANYLKFFERCRTEWMRQIGHDQSQLASDAGIVFVARRAGCEYLKPARLDDLLTVDVRVLEARRATLLLAQVARRHETGEPLVISSLRVAALDRASGRPVGIPRWLLERITPSL